MRRPLTVSCCWGQGNSGSSQAGLGGISSLSIVLPKHSVRSTCASAPSRSRFCYGLGHPLPHGRGSVTDLGIRSLTVAVLLRNRALVLLTPCLNAVEALQNVFGRVA